MARQKVRKAVIAAAGFGTRFLPQTKAMPKEMLPLVDKPIIQYIVEQLVEAGIEDIIIVSGYSKRSIEDHFDTPNEDLLNNLRAGGPKKTHYIEETKRIADLANFAYVRQKGPYGTGTPIMNTAHLVGSEPFIYTFADDITIGQPNIYQQMITAYEELNGSIIACLRIHEDADFDRYGIFGGERIRDDVIRAENIIEKPGKANAPSDFAGIGGHLLTPDVFDYIEQGVASLKPNQEFYATDQLFMPMAADGKPIYGLEIKDLTRYDTGNPTGYIKAVVDFALERDDIGPELRAHLQKILQ
jgi:UTP--glucose-1-phosphate uridylyltransferase